MEVAVGFGTVWLTVDRDSPRWQCYTTAGVIWEGAPWLDCDSLCNGSFLVQKCQNHGKAGVLSSRAPSSHQCHCSRTRRGQGLWLRKPSPWPHFDQPPLSSLVLICSIYFLSSVRWLLSVDWGNTRLAKKFACVFPCHLTEKAKQLLLLICSKLNQHAVFSILSKIIQDGWAVVAGTTLCSQDLQRGPCLTICVISLDLFDPRQAGASTEGKNSVRYILKSIPKYYSIVMGVVCGLTWLHLGTGITWLLYSPWDFEVKRLQRADLLSEDCMVSNNNQLSRRMCTTTTVKKDVYLHSRGILVEMSSGTYEKEGSFVTVTRLHQPCLSLAYTPPSNYALIGMVQTSNNFSTNSFSN